VVQGFGSLVLLEEGLSDSVRESIQQMDAAGRSMSELNKRLLVAGGCVNVNCAAADLQPMFGFFEDKAKGLCREHGVDLNFQANPGIPSVMIDSNRFNEVFDELLKNAVESAADTQRKAISVEFYGPNTASSTGHVDIFIRNTCPDFDPQRLATMYESFHSTKRGDHFGIGLTVAGVLCGQMDIRLGLQYRDRKMSAWLSVPLA